MGVRFGEKGATPAEKGAIQRAEGHRSTAGVDGTLPGVHGTWQTKITKPPSKVTLSCPAAPLLPFALYISIRREGVAAPSTLPLGPFEEEEGTQPRS